MPGGSPPGVLLPDARLAVGKQQVRLACDIESAVGVSSGK
jgi:hypothetical protein